MQDRLAVFEGAAPFFAGVRCDHGCCSSSITHQHPASHLCAPRQICVSPYMPLVVVVVVVVVVVWGAARL